MTYRAAPVQFQVVNGQTTNATLSFAAIDGKIHLTLEAGSVTPSVSITGPDGFAHTLTAGGFSSLPYLKPGQYTISAAAATDGTYQYAASVTPASLDLQAGQVGVVNVAYQAVTGTLSVSLMGTPEGRSFTLNGPDGFSASVQHGSALKDLKGGVYTLEGASFTDGGWTYTPDTSTVTVVSGQPASLSVTFTRQDVQAPQHVTLQAPAKVSAAGDATFTVSASDNDRVATFKLYEGTTLLGTQSAQDGAASFTVSYASADQGTHIYHVVAVDAAGNEAGSAESTVLVDFNGDPVVVGTIADQTVLRNQTIQVELAGAFSDPNGDALTYSVTPASFQGATLSVSGSILSITKANNNSSGEVTVTVTATDPSGKSASTTCQLTVIR
ncbi:Ig-like domain-containing protein [Deinococcus peraridilitoris]